MQENDNKDQKIADLEAKLAESKEQLIAMNEKSNKIKKESYYLKQQLAEKEKFFERIMSGEYIPANIAEKSLKLSNQTAIAELEKVKAELEFTSNNNEWITARDDRILNGICDYIDQQIKSLKGEN